MRLSGQVLVADLGTRAELEDALTDVFHLDLATIDPDALAEMWTRMEREHERWTVAGRP